MRAGLPKREPEMLQEMYDHDLYHKMVKRNEGKPTFVLHDGPPYANGNIHIGTALNKILKDMIVKHRNMTGWCAPYVPGWVNGDVIDGILSEQKKEVDKVIINSAELEKYFGKDKTPREMKDTILALLDEWKEKQPPYLINTICN